MVHVQNLRNRQELSGLIQLPRPTWIGRRIHQPNHQRHRQAVMRPVVHLENLLPRKELSWLIQRPRINSMTSPLRKGMKFS
jgi:hypothetical protein